MAHDPQNLFFILSETLETAFEWLLVRETGANATLKRADIEVIYKKGRVLLECPTPEGVKTWRIKSLEEGERVEKGEKVDNKLLLTASADFGSETEKIELIPRTTAADLLAAIREARLEIAGKIAGAAAAKIAGAKIASVRLSKGVRAGEYGSNAQILLQIAPGKQAAVFAQVTRKGIYPEGLLVAAIWWFNAVSQRAKKNRIEKLWLAADKKLLRKLKKVAALLKPGWRERVSLFEIDLENAALREIKIPEMRNLWREKIRKLKIPAAQIPTELAQKIADLAPEAIDITYSAHGENLRFHGLPFARVRSLLGTERAWFGAGKKRRLLEPGSDDELRALAGELKKKRHHRTAEKDHYFYRASPEHWLESLLSRDITRLDANLILSPIYRQFRASSEQIDLLALRRDGRLVVIELKVSPSRECVFQAANYWRLIESHRRSGNLREARAFGDLEIADEPALVCLAAPALSFHRDLEFWAGLISPKIEIYRYELHENWREEIKVLQRSKLGG